MQARDIAILGESCADGRKRFFEKYIPITCVAESAGQGAPGFAIGCHKVLRQNRCEELDGGAQAAQGDAGLMDVLGVFAFTQA